MKQLDKSGESPAWIGTLLTIIATVIGAAFALIIGVIFVSSGFWQGVFVLVLTVVGAVVGRFYLASERPWWGGQ